MSKGKKRGVQVRHAAPAERGRDDERAAQPSPSRSEPPFGRIYPPQCLMECPGTTGFFSSVGQTHRMWAKGRKVLSPDRGWGQTLPVLLQNPCSGGPEERLCCLGFDSRCTKGHTSVLECQSSLCWYLFNPRWERKSFC